MRFSILLFVSCALIACGQSKHTEQSSAHASSQTEETRVERLFNVAFYNVENLFDTRDDSRKDDDDFTPDGRNEWSEGRYERKIQNLGKVIQAMDDGDGLPALIGLAEVENEEVVRDLGDFIGPNTYGVVHQESLDHRGIDVALLYDRRRVEILDDEALRISFSERGYTSRDILHVHGRADGDEFHLFLNHWPSRRGGQSETEHRRLDAARTLKKGIDAILADDASANIIVLGDFNDYPDNKSMTDILVCTTSDTKKKKELINLAYAPHMKDLGTYPYKGDWGMLDQAVISDALVDGQGMDLDEDGLEIFKKDFMMYYDKRFKEYKPNRTYGGPKYYGGYSDHLPILLHLKTNTSP